MLKNIFNLFWFAIALFYISEIFANKMNTPISPLPDSIVYKNGKYFSKIDNMELAYVSAGEFIQGNNNGHYDEKPEHKIYLDSYFIDVHEVTNRQFEKFIIESGYKAEGPWKRGFKKGYEEYPVRFVNWYDAKAYAKWAGRQLPTESQWEKAAKGSLNYTYPWGMDYKENKAHTDKKVLKGPTKIGSYPKGASQYGCMDMAGNVWEWVNDWYDRFYYHNFSNEKVQKNVAGPKDEAQPEKRFLDTKTAAGNERSTRKVIRGGGWAGSGKENSRVSKRMMGNPKYWLNDTGFRCALSLNTK